jgi:hypothetical protein
MPGSPIYMDKQPTYMDKQPTYMDKQPTYMDKQPQKPIPDCTTTCSPHNCRSKDESTTQSTLGFRLCGMVLQQGPGSSSSSGSIGGSNGGSSGNNGGGSSGSNGNGSSGCAVERYDRHWGKALTTEGVTEALRCYAEVGKHKRLGATAVGSPNVSAAVAAFKAASTLHALRPVRAGVTLAAAAGGH